MSGDTSAVDPERCVDQRQTYVHKAALSTKIHMVRCESSVSFLIQVRTSGGSLTMKGEFEMWILDPGSV